MKASVTTSNLPLTLEGVVLRIGDTTILDHVGLTIRPGPPTLLVGPNGSGKSSLLRLCMGLERPSAGRILWGGRTDCAAARQAMLFQRPVMLRRSAADNIAYALAKAGVDKRDRSARIEALLARVGLTHRAGHSARTLSGGEQQRLALARALAREPEILFLDEPTANLDPASSRIVEAIVRESAAAGIKVVMASHDLAQVKRLAGDVLFLDRGRLREQKTVTEFFDTQMSPASAAFVRGDLWFDEPLESRTTGASS
ncbi:ATP-binding cassette domain-containing protein [Aureimonas glaciei]|uniref:ABC transporter ATP-binding protein n=1 Tax=Aureimonas glaciei TaxID=1776957 RepID=A0A916XTI4_9HYPH|nr:ATP-binding cassette domain-containing protein [Aureimonas glaciei]GGD09073.1 ABC transporter ATP-binding protein [Aureimonas glaciei]